MSSGGGVPPWIHQQSGVGVRGKVVLFPTPQAPVYRHSCPLNKIKKSWGRYPLLLRARLTDAPVCFWYSRTAATQHLKPARAGRASSIVPLFVPESNGYIPPFDSSLPSIFHSQEWKRVPDWFWLFLCLEAAVGNTSFSESPLIFHPQERKCVIPGRFRLFSA